MASTMEIKVVAQDQATSTLKRIRGEMAETEKGGVLEGANKAAETLEGGLSGMAKAVGVGAIVAIGVEAGKAALELENMGEESAQMEAKFRVFTGGARQAEQALKAMQDATGLAMTQDDQMAAETTILSHGLAKNAEDAAQLAKAAVWLGDSQQTAMQRVDGLTKALQTGRTAGLMPYNMDLTALKARTKELQDANAGLSASQALTQAFMEQAGSQMDKLAGEGYKATTATTEFKNAWANMLDATASKVSPVIEVVVRAVAKVVQDVSTSISTGPESEAATRTLSELEDANKRLALAQQVLAYETQNGTDDMIRGAQAEKDAADVTQFHAAAAYDAAKATAQYASDARAAAGGSIGYVRAMNGLELALRGTTIAQQGLNKAVEDMPTVTAADRFAAEKRDPFGNKAGWFADSLTAGQKASDRVFLDIANAGIKAGTTAAKAWDTAFDQSASRIGGYVSGAMDRAKSLFDVLHGGKDFNVSTDPNGAFRDVFRALDVAKLGDASPWAKTLGKTQEQAKQIAADFERGIMSENVKSLIDMPALVNEARMAGLAEASQKAFSEAIAKAAGTSTGAVNGLLGLDASGGVAGPAAAVIGTGAASWAGLMVQKLDAQGQMFADAGKRAAQSYLDGGSSAGDSGRPSGTPPAGYGLPAPTAAPNVTMNNHSTYAPTTVYAQDQAGLGSALEQARQASQRRQAVGF